jgi:hypothetical protein
MNIPTELIAAFGAVALTAALGYVRSSAKRIARVEKNVLVLIIMLRDRGFQVPDERDTEQFAKSHFVY